MTTQRPARQLGAVSALARAMRGLQAPTQPEQELSSFLGIRDENPSLGFIYLCQGDERLLCATAQRLYLTAENSNICTSLCQPSVLKLNCSGSRELTLEQPSTDHSLCGNHRPIWAGKDLPAHGAQAVPDPPCVPSPEWPLPVSDHPSHGQIPAGAHPEPERIPPKAHPHLCSVLPAGHEFLLNGKGEF